MRKIRTFNWRQEKEEVTVSSFQEVSPSLPESILQISQILNWVSHEKRRVFSTIRAHYDGLCVWHWKNKPKTLCLSNCPRLSEHSSALCVPFSLITHSMHFTRVRTLLLLYNDFMEPALIQLETFCFFGTLVHLNNWLSPFLFCYFRQLGSLNSYMQKEKHMNYIQ